MKEEVIDCNCVQADSGLQQQEPVVVRGLRGVGWLAACPHHHILLLRLLGKTRLFTKNTLQTIYIPISDSKSSLNDPKKTDDPQEDDEEEDGENEGAGDEEEGGEDEGEEEGEESGQDEGEEEEGEDEEDDEPPTTRSQARKRRPRKD